MDRTVLGDVLMGDLNVDHNTVKNRKRKDNLLIIPSLCHLMTGLILFRNEKTEEVLWAWII